MLLANILLTFTSVIALLLGLFILASNPRKPVNRALSTLIFGVFLWQLANLLANISADPGRALFFTRATLIGPGILTFSFLLFCKIFTGAKNFSYKQAIELGIIPLGLILLFPTELNIVSTDAYGFNAKAGPLYYVLIPIVAVYFVWGLVLLNRFRRKTRDAVLRAQTRLIFAGVVFSLVPGLFANGVLPALGYSNAASYGPSVIIILAIFMAIAIVRHRLLDIKLIVARSVAYVLLLGFITLIFAGLVITVPANLIGTGKPSIERQLYYTFAAIVLAFSFQSLRRFFDKITNKLFYQDAYDPQAFLEELNGVIVSNIELDTLLSQCIEVIEKNMKVEFSLFGLRETTYSERRMIGGDHRKFSEEDIQKVRAATPSLHQRIIVTDELEDGHEHLHKILNKNDIAVIGRLSTDIVHTTEGIGYLILGPKKSGNPFNRQDVKLLEIIVKELVVAVQNSMRFEEIKNFNVTLQEKVETATKELQRSNQKLKELDETKDDFISMASHQLRTPLTSVKGYLSMVLEGDAGKLNANQAKLLDQAFISSQRMVFLISDLLNLSRLKTGKFVVETQPVNLTEIIEGEVDQLVETAAARGLKLTFDKPTHFPLLMLDETKIRQVIMNFVDNAIYYTPSGGEIKVTLQELPNSVELTVTDNGIGVPKHEQHHLFTKFYRAGNAKKARPDGTGLGLFMAKKVIIAQGGSVLFNSTEGKGSTFGFTFSKAKLQPPVITPKPAEIADHK